MELPDKEIDAFIEEQMPDFQAQSGYVMGKLRRCTRKAFALGSEMQRKRDADIAWGHVDDTRNAALTIARQIEEG